MRRPIRSPLLAALLPVVALLPAAGCSKPRELYVDHAWLRLPAVAGQPAAAYFTVHGGSKDARLIDVSTDVAIRAEMHETMRGGGAGAAGMTRMAPVAAIPIPAKSTDAFAPGGRHVMVFGLDPSVKRGGAITLTFTFGDGLRIQQAASVVGAGDPAPKG